MQAIQHYYHFLFPIVVARLKVSSLRYVFETTAKTFFKRPDLRLLMLGAGLTIGSTLTQLPTGQITIINPFNLPNQPLENKILRCSTAILGLIIASYSTYNL